MGVFIIEKLNVLYDLPMSVAYDLCAQRSWDFIKQLFLVKEGEMLMMVILKESFYLVLHFIRQLSSLGELT